MKGSATGKLEWTHELLLYHACACLPPPPLHIGLDQREAQVNHELLFNHA